MGIFIKVILIIALVGLLYAGLTTYVGQTGIDNQLAHIPTIFDYMAQSLNNFHTVFPWVYDLVIAVSAVFSVEILVLLYKFARWILSFFRN